MNQHDGPQSGEVLLARLGTGGADRLAAIARSVSGALPVFGATIGEVLTAVIPHQRADRVLGFLVELDRRLQSVERETVDRRLGEPEGIDLLEDGVIQAARALTEERRDMLAAAVKNGIADDALGHLQKKKLLSIFERLNDVEVLILQSYLRENYHDKEFQQKHLKALHGPRAYIGAPKGEIDQAAVHATYRQHLRDLGLLKPRFKPRKRGQLPEFDENTGSFKASGSELTRLGGLLLRFLDLTDQDF